MNTNKDKLRKSLKPIANKEEKDQKIVKYLEFFLKEKKVALYMALDDEPNLSKLLNEDIYLPISKETIEINDLDLIVIPGLAYNKKGYRLGRGKGYYDRALEKFSGLKIGLIYDDLLLDDEFQEDHDLKVDILITEKRVVKLEV